MEMTAADDRPAGTKEPAPATRPPSRRDVAVIAATSGGMAFAGYLPWLWYATCDGMTCLIVGPAAGAFSVVVMPAVAWACWAMFGIPRPFRLAVAMVVIDHVLVIAVVNGFGGGFGGPAADGRVIGQAELGPALVYVLVGACAGLAAIVLFWKGAWSRRVRVGVVALIAAANLAAYTVGARASGPQAEDRLGQVSVTTYLLDIPGATASGASVWDFNGVRITYDFDYGPGKDLRGPVVFLLEHAELRCGDPGVDPLVQIGDFPKESTCRRTPDGFVVDDGAGLHYVRVARGDTMLVFASPASTFEGALIADALRAAPEISRADLAPL